MRSASSRSSAHGVIARRARRSPLLDVQFGLGLFLARLSVESACIAHAWPGAALARERAGTLQDAAPSLRRPAGALRRYWLGAVQTQLVALVSVFADHHAAVHLSRLQGCAVAMVGIRNSLRRGAF